jgi:hypothetical protein
MNPEVITRVLDALHEDSAVARLRQLAGLKK